MSKSFANLLVDLDRARTQRAAEPISFLVRKFAKLLAELNTGGLFVFFQPYFLLSEVGLENMLSGESMLMKLLSTWESENPVDYFSDSPEQISYLPPMPEMRIEECVTFLSKAMSRKLGVSESRDVKITLARCRVVTGQYSVALEQLKDLEPSMFETSASRVSPTKVVDPQNSVALLQHEIFMLLQFSFLKGFALERTGDIAQAIGTYERALEIVFQTCGLPTSTARSSNVWLEEILYRLPLLQLQQRLVFLFVFALLADKCVSSTAPVLKGLRLYLYLPLTRTPAREMPHLRLIAKMLASPTATYTPIKEHLDTTSVIDRYSFVSHFVYCC